MEVIGIDSKLKEKGLTLLEALVATAIVGIGFIAVFQMVNYSVRSIDVSGERTKSNYITAMICLLYTSPSPRDVEESRMPSSA